MGQDFEIVAYRGKPIAIADIARVLRSRQWPRG
jgi:hypothetical protein